MKSMMQQYNHSSYAQDAQYKQNTVRMLQVLQATVQRHMSLQTYVPTYRANKYHIHYVSPGASKTSWPLHASSSSSSVMRVPCSFDLGRTVHLKAFGKL